MSRAAAAALILSLAAWPLAAEGPRERIAAAAPALAAGRPWEAKIQLTKALAEFRELKDPYGEAAALMLLGTTEVSLDNVEQARADLEEAVEKLRKLDDPIATWMAFITLARLEKGMGRYTAALGRQDEALAVITAARTSNAPFRLSTFASIGFILGMPSEMLDKLPVPPELIKPILLQYLCEPLTHDGYATLFIETGQYERAEEELTAAVGGAQLFAGMYDSIIAVHYGDLRFRQGRFDEARLQYQKALRGSGGIPTNALGEQTNLTSIYRRLAEIELAAGRGDDALGWNDKLLAMARGARNRNLEASALDDRGLLLMRLNRFGEAETVYQEALQAAIAGHNDERQASIESSLGGLSLLAGNYGTAAAHLETAIELYRSLNDPLSESTLWMTLAEVHILTQTDATADKVLARARELAETSNFELACDLIALMETWRRYTHGTATASELEAAIRQFERNPDLDSIDAGRDLQHLLRNGILFAHQDASAPEAVGSRSDGLPVLVAFNSMTEGRRQLERGNLAVARQIFQRAASVMSNRELRAGCKSLIAVTYWKEGSPEPAIRWLLESAKELDLVVDDLRADTMMAGFLGGERHAYYDILVEFLLQDGQIEKAFDASERARARAFLRLLGNHRLKPPPGPTSQVAEEMETLRQQIAKWDQDPVPGETIEGLRLRYEALLPRVQASGAEYASLTNVEPLQLSAVRKELPADTTLISYFASAFGIHALILDAETIEHVKLPLNAAQLRRITCWANQLGQTRSARPAGGTECGTDPATPADAYDALIAPLRSRIRKHGLMIVPHRELHYVPFAALYDRASGRYLVEDFTITYAPSASSLRFLHAKESPVEGGALVLGDPEAPAQSDLPGAKNEARKVAEKLHTTAWLGKDAQKARIYALQGKVDLVHIAAHASYDAASPLFSAVYLAPGSGRSGTLSVDEIQFEVDLSGVNLVVLSACRSGLGKRSEGDEIVGLTRAILYAGSPGVISTLWSINDLATAPLIEKFYERLLAGASAADALRDAQIELLHTESYKDPYYWAAFLLTGNPAGKWTH